MPAAVGAEQPEDLLDNETLEAPPDPRLRQQGAAVRPPSRACRRPLSRQWTLGL